MKIKIITCHDVLNAGASLQSYALQEYFIQQGYNVQIIDYNSSKKERYIGVYSERCKNNPILKGIYTIVKFKSRINRNAIYKSFQLFKKKYQIVTEDSYESFNELKENPPEADIYIAGSDQIWNTYIRKGIDRAFFLDFVPEGKIKASYAASFSLDEIPMEYHSDMAKLLNRFDYISVREESGIRILKRLGITKGVHVVDPVFLLDQNFWEDFCDHIVLPKNKYLLLYDFDHNKEMEQYARRIAKKYGLKIYSVYKSRYAKCIQKFDPVKFVAYIRGAEFIISNSFHATAFSIIFEKQFAVFNRKENINTRMRDLLDLLGLESRFEKRSNYLDYKIDYIKVNTILKYEIQQSKRFLKGILRERIND